MINLESDSTNGLFTAACAKILCDGERVSPRGTPTFEVLGASLHLTSPRSRLVDVPPIRVLNPAFAVAETLWILSGSGEVWIHEFNDRLASYVGTGRPHGAYGPRLRRWAGEVDQVDRIRMLLQGDRESRQAVV